MSPRIAFNRLLGRGADDRGSLPAALLLSLIGVSLTAVLVPVTVRQINSTGVDVRRSTALSAAQTGLDVAIGHIRAAADSDGNGALADLPCGPLDGTVEGGGARYRVSLDYFVLDPQGRSSAWIAQNRITCSSGGGVFRTPSYALLRSRGTDRATGDITSVQGRTLEGTYTFQTTNKNIAGGLIHIYKTKTSTDLCMDAGSASPNSGTNLVMQPCSSGSTQQKFAYNTNLTIALVASQTLLNPLGMCLDAGPTHAVGNAVTFQPCALVTSPRQQWSINDQSNFEGTANGSTLDGFCFNVQSPNVSGSLVVLGSAGSKTCRQSADNIETWQPEAAVGAGAAGASSGQIVNFSQFGRCIDVTNYNVSSSFIIVWPCKQAPDPTKVGWNQRWTIPTVLDGALGSLGLISTTSAKDGKLYCLQSPNSTAPYTYVVVKSCTATSSVQNLLWTVFGKTLDYATSYRIVDGFGNCLSSTDPNATNPDVFTSGQLVTKLIVEPCSASTRQKWNAPPTILQSLPLKDIKEN